jgi:aryl-alcohol dehydrogenase-like predicted oxidoreductase
MYGTTEGTARYLDCFPKCRAIQLTRSVPGIAAALVGMGRREHVLENLGVALVAPVTHEQYLRLYQ